MTSATLGPTIASGDACCVCGTTDARIWRRAPDNLLGGPEIFTAVRCVRCGTVRLQPRPNPNDMARYYSAATYARAEGEESELAKRLDAFFAHQAIRAMDAFGPGFAVRAMLDVGCGDGRFLKAMANHGWTGAGIETDPVAANLARARSAATIYETTLEAAPFEDESFDLISLLHVLEHVPDPRATLSAAFRLLRPGGKLLLAMPNVHCLESLLFGRYWYQLDLPRHFWGYTPRTLVRLVEEAGFVGPRLRYLPFIFVPQSLRCAARGLLTSPGAPKARATMSADRGGSGFQTRLFLGILSLSERAGNTFPGEVMELTSTKSRACSAASHHSE